MTIQKAPKMIEYFNQMGANFRLLIGSDMLVKALSEQQLPKERRQVEGLLRVCNNIGSTLVLTEPVLEEIFTHLYAADREYKNHYLPNEAYLSPGSVAECDRILIRAYYYSKFEGGKISWDKFLNQFVDPVALRSREERGRQELKAFIIMRFKMEYLSKEEISTGIAQEDVNDLAEQLQIGARAGKNKELSYNDALMAHAVYRLRKSDKESANYDGFGYRTWWLSKETKILNVTGQLVKSEGGVPYIMRPEFILNFIALSPKAAHVRKALRDLLPTTVGLQLGQHMRPEVMHDLLSSTEEHASLSSERCTVIIEDKVNRIKHDRYKLYTENIVCN